MRHEDLPHVTIYTDGACRPNPGPGGWAAILRFGRHEMVLTGSEADTTNNRMELQAAIAALQALKVRCRVELYVDSVYVRRGITEWLPRWRSRGWYTSDGRRVKNMDLWQKLDRLARNHRVRWNWLKGHMGHPGNERVHRLAYNAMNEEFPGDP